MKLVHVMAIIFILILFDGAHAQQTNNWYFGSPAGFPNTGLRVDFTSGSPVVSTCIPMQTEEGSSSISDASGNPLLYTDGVTLWDGATDTVIASGLLGNPSSTQSAIIIPKPGTTSQWLLFTIGAVGMNGVNYYTVTREALMGRLSVSTVTNLVPPAIVGEGLCIINSKKVGSAFWLIARDANNPLGGVRAWDVSNVGVVNPVAVTSNLSAPAFVNTSYSSYIGTIKSNTCQNKLAFTYLNGDADISDFDAANGVLVANTARRILVTSIGSNSGSYGIEFSTNDQYLYITNLSSGNVYSYLVEAPYTLTLLATLTASAEAGQLQIAPNGVIYMARKNLVSEVGPSYLSSISSPSTGGVFNEMALQVNLIGCAGKFGFSYRGLPTFPKPFVVSSLTLNSNDLSSCSNTTTNNSISSHPTNLSFDVFPNPMNDKVTIGLNNSSLSGIGLIVIYNTLGKEIYSQPIDATDLASGITLDLPWIINGSHTIKVITAEGEWVARMIKN